MGITISAFHFKYTRLDFQDWYIERSTTEIVNSNCFVANFGAVKTISQSRSCRFIDNTENIQTSDGTGILCCLTLSCKWLELVIWRCIGHSICEQLTVIEVGGDSNDCVFDVLSKIGFGGFLHFSNYKSTNLGRTVLLSSRLYPGVTIAMWYNLERNSFDIFLDFWICELASNQSLGCEQSILWIHDSLT